LTSRFHSGATLIHPLPVPRGGSVGTVKGSCQSEGGHLHPHSQGEGVCTSIRAQISGNLLGPGRAAKFFMAPEGIQRESDSVDRLMPHLEDTPSSPAQPPRLGQSPQLMHRRLASSPPPMNRWYTEAVESPRISPLLILLRL
jgi:hypothetical protein